MTHEEFRNILHLSQQGQRVPPSHVLELCHAYQVLEKQVKRQVLGTEIWPQGGSHND